MHITIQFNSVIPKIPDETLRPKSETQERKRFPERKVVNGLYYFAEEK